MTQFKYLIREIHRRSLWQVMGIFLAASWGVLQVVEVITETVGLPDWTPGMAFVLLLIGMPIVIATAFVQEGMPGVGATPTTARTVDAGSGEAGQSGESQASGDLEASADAASTTRTDAVTVAAPSSIPRSLGMLTWRNAILGGLGAFTLLGISLVGYFVMWEAGIGPWGNLAAQGVFEDGEPIVLAEFSNQSNDPTLSGVVTEALRVDLAASQVITLVSTSFVDEILGLMQADDDQRLTAEVAREVATRGGIKAVVEGEVGSAGSGYILSATIRATDSGDPLATFRRTAKSAEDVIDAIDGLSQDIREKAGESLRAIKAEAPLHQVTTSSLEALRLYAEAEYISDRGDVRRAKGLLQEALKLDPSFGMAWRKLAVAISTAGGEPGEQQAAATRAFELSERLTLIERGNAVAYYHNVVTGDVPAQIQAYEGILASYPDDAAALNNLAIAYHDRTRHEDAIALLERAIAGPGVSAPAYTNLSAYYAGKSRIDDARAKILEMAALYPERRQWPTWLEWWADAMAGLPDEAHGHADDMVTMPDIPESWRAFGLIMAATTDAAAGHLGEARDHLRQGMARHGALGDAEGIESLVLDGALIELYASGDTQRVRTSLADYLGSDDFEAIPAEARSWITLAHVMTLARDREGLSDLFERWSAGVGPQAGTALSEARVAADAFGRQSEASTINALEAFRSQIGCPLCFEWQIAELNEARGEVVEAAAGYERIFEAPTSGFYQDFPVQRALAHERLGMIYEALGEEARAAEHYAAFAQAWASADAEFQPRVRHATERARALGGSP
jgi:eukaryotic-like serine/threonine-protein kinase